MIDLAIIFNLFDFTSSVSVATLQSLPFAVTPSAAIASLSMDTNASVTQITLDFFPLSEVFSLNKTLAPITFASTSVSRIVSAVAFANRPLVIITLSASIRQKSEKVQYGCLQNTGIG